MNAGQEWRLRAACRTSDPAVALFFGVADIWFCDNGSAAHAPGRACRAKLARSAALQVCGTCEVVTECLEMALRAELADPDHLRYGIFGGTTPAERHRMARAAR